jgi:TRAP-type mannitol/chloroaromatic compound transport system permease small subunit
MRTRRPLRLPISKEREFVHRSRRGTPPAPVRKGGLVQLLLQWLQRIDRLNRFSGAVDCWLIYPLIFVLAYEFTARYFFGAPTIWAYDFSYMLYGALYMLGLGYTLLEDGHVKIEFFYEKMSPRKKNITDIIGYLIFFFPAVGALFYYGLEFTWTSWVMEERAKESIFSPPIYPLKTIMLIGIFLLLLQGIAKFSRKVILLLGREQ